MLPGDPKSMTTKWMGTLLLVASGAVATAGGLSFPGLFPPSFRGSEKPNPAIEALRDYKATLHTTLGNIELALDPDSAPNAVRNFIKLAQQGFYDGSRFGCILKGRMIFAGAAHGGEAPQPIDYESSAAGHAVGSVAMDTVPADTKDKQAPKRNSGSRFFINLAAQHHLDDDYTVFASIANGLTVAQRIGEARTRPGDGQPAPIEDILIERITITKKTQSKPETKEKE